ncbi:MAG: four helix bundle protein [Candidatus Sungbacteria bacterium]|nr:four helix bundle protein [Candidatus Sungbacteria bacterium]
MGEYTKSYKDLLVWQRSHLLAKRILELTKTIKRDAISAVIIGQITRSVTSAPANIVEGYYTRRGKQFISYLERSRGSLAETDYWLFLATDLGYIPRETYPGLSKEINEIILMLSSLIHKSVN